MVLYGLAQDGMIVFSQMQQILLLLKQTFLDPIQM